MSFHVEAASTGARSELMPDRPTMRAKRVWGEVKEILLTCALLLAAGTAIGQPFIVPSGSMEPTLMVGDEIAAAKYAYGYSRFSAPFGLLPSFSGRILDQAPERGDVVVFALPRDPSQVYVKRVIGLPGDHIQMRHGVLFLNGAAVSRRLVGPITVDDREARAMKYVETLPNGRSHDIIKLEAGPLDDTPEFTVPDHSYFMMGDNRDNSLDSRVSPTEGGVGYVPAENLIGRVDRVLFSITPFTGWLDAAGNLRDLRLSRVLHAVQ
jgi:signal peptidase I